jgi:hypothetical protein
MQAKVKSFNWRAAGFTAARLGDRVPSRSTTLAGIPVVKNCEVSFRAGLAGVSPALFYSRQKELVGRVRSHG